MNFKILALCLALLMSGALNAMEALQESSIDSNRLIQCTACMQISLKWSGKLTTTEVTDYNHGWDLATFKVTEPKIERIFTAFTLNKYANLAETVEKEYPNSPYAIALSFKALSKSEVNLICTITDKETSSCESKEILFPLYGDEVDYSFNLFLNDVNNKGLTLYIQDV